MKQNNFLLIILILSSVLLFINLGDRTLFGDEAFTVIVAKTITEGGYPSSYYRDFLINPKDTSNFKIGDKDVYTWNTWTQYYIANGIYSIFGLNEFALRVPFVLIGLATICLLYFFTKKLTNDETIARFATIILALSVPFVLHIKQVRWYALVSFFTLAVCYSYWLFINEEESKEKSSALFFFTLSCIWLFYSNLLTFFGIMVAVTSHFFVFRVLNLNKKLLKKMIISLLITAFCTAPWFFITGQLSKLSGASMSIKSIVFNIALYWYYAFVLLIPALFLLIFLFKKYRKELFQPNYVFIMFIIVVFICFSALKVDHLPAIRYIICLTPLFCILNAYVIVKIKEYNKFLGYIILMILIMSNLLHTLPIMPLGKFANGIDANVSDYEKERFITSSTELKFPLVNYINEITHDYEGTEEAIINYINKHKGNNDTFTTSHFENVFILHNDIRYIPPEKIEKDDEPDWIIKRNFKINEFELGIFENSF